MLTQPLLRGSILPSQTSTQTLPLLETTLSPTLALPTCPISLGARSLHPSLESPTVQQPVLSKTQPFPIGREMFSLSCFLKKMC